MRKRDAISILKDSIPGNYISIKISLITEAEIKSIIYSLNPPPPPPKKKKKKTTKKKKK